LSDGVAGLGIVSRPGAPLLPAIQAWTLTAESHYILSIRDAAAADQAHGNI